MNKNFSVAFVAIMMSMIWICSPVMAAESERHWIQMNPDRFESTSESAYDQCFRAASLPGSAVVDFHCVALKSMLDKDECEVQLVPDGIRFDLMSTYEKGRPTVVGPMTKKLGRTDQATVCNLGDGITAYFFVGEGTSCGNLAFVVETPEVVEIARAAPLPDISLSLPPPVPECRWVATDRKVKTISGQAYVTSSTLLVGCNGTGGVVVGGNAYQAPSSSSVSTTYEKVCD